MLKLLGLTALRPKCINPKDLHVPRLPCGLMGSEKLGNTKREPWIWINAILTRNYYAGNGQGRQRDMHARPCYSRNMNPTLSDGVLGDPWISLTSK
jgi:hypothetical protein